MYVRWLILCVAAACLLCGARSGGAKDVEVLTLGAAAPDFSLPGVDGETYSLESFKESKLLVVLFTCNHCPTAQAYEDRIMEFHNDYREKGVALVAISPNSAEAVRLDELGYTDLGDSLDDMKLRAEEREFQFPYLYDGETQETSEEYGVLATPHVYVFDEERKLRYVGRIDDNELRTPKRQDLRMAVDELLAGKDVSVPETRVFGCSTKWKDKIKSAEESLAKWNKEEVQVEKISADALVERLHGESEKFRLVNVWATFCIPCLEEMDALVEIHRMYRNRHFEVISVSADAPDMLPRAQELLDEKHLSATNYILDSDDRDELFDAVDKEWKGALPYTALIAPSGEVVYRVHGEFDPLELRRVIVKHIGRTYASKK